MAQAVFLDRDGTIARDVPYCRRPEDFELLPGVPQGIKLLHEHGFKVIIVTNQSGIARGYFSEETLYRIHDKMRRELAQEGASVDAIYYCPHHPNDGCLCRKPNTALFERAAQEWGLKLGQAYVIGDREMDMVAAQRMGYKAVLIPNEGTEKSLLAQGNQYPVKPDFISPDFPSAAHWVVADALKSKGAVP